MSNVAQPNAASFSVTSCADIERILSDCSGRKQPVVTVASEVLQSRSWRAVPGAVAIDLSRMNAVRIDVARRLALVGPGARFSSLVTEALKAGMMPEIETPACLDFTFADWSDEPLRMLSTSFSGSDGILRNVKVTAPGLSYQTGYDSFPANGGGYDLTKLFLSSGMSLGVPTEFAIPLRPVPEIAIKRICSFEKAENAVSAGVQISRSGYARAVKLKSGGFDEMLIAGKLPTKQRIDNLLVVKMEGTQPIMDAGMKFVDDVLAKGGGKVAEDKQDAPTFVDPQSISQSVWPLGICAVDTKSLAAMLKNIRDIALKSNRAFQFSVSDLSPTTSVLLPLLQGPKSKEPLDAIGKYLADERVSLRGNPGWNSILGDSRAVARVEVVRGIKKLVDPDMILNPHVMEVF